MRYIIMIVLMIDTVLNNVWHIVVRTVYLLMSNITAWNGNESATLTQQDLM